MITSKILFHFIPVDICIDISINMCMYIYNVISNLSYQFMQMLDMQLPLLDISTEE
jgi:hypothetical protein